MPSVSFRPLPACGERVGGWGACHTLVSYSHATILARVSGAVKGCEKKFFWARLTGLWSGRRDIGVGAATGGLPGLPSRDCWRIREG
jgi:hypothetical protein